MAPRSRTQGESKRGLIITLVFFVLATIGLGVASYFGFAEAGNSEKKAAEAKKSEETFKEERNWYKFQSKMLYSYVGKTEGMEGVDTLGTEKADFDRGSMKSGGGKDKDFATKALKDLETQLAWNGNQPKETLESRIDRLTKEKQTLVDRITNLDTTLANSKKKLEEAEEEIRLARKDYDTKLKELTETFKRDFEKSNKDLADFRNEVEKVSQERDKLRKDAEELKKGLESKLVKKDVEIRDLRDLSQKKDEEMNQFRIKHPVAPESMRTDWRIVRMDTRGLNPYVNLGSADNVKPQLTFNIHGLGLDGRINPQPKGTLEIANVIGPHLSQARITSVQDRNRDPITQGDVVCNASWNPNLKKHVAVAGYIDLTGDNRDSLYEFMRNLDRQNIVVDAYLDPKDGSIKGKITYQTDFLILGSPPDLSVASKSSELDKQISSAYKQMQEEAKKHGVQVKGLGGYLDMIGYRLPHNSRFGQSSLYNPDLRPEQAPRVGGDNAPPPMPTPDK